MAKQLVLTTSAQKLTVDSVPDLAIFATKDREQNIVSNDIIERNEETGERELVPTSNLLNLDGFVFATQSNSVVEI